MCGGGGAPEDNSDKVAAIEAQRAKEAAAQERKDAAKKEAAFGRSLQGAYGVAEQSGRDYLTGYGVDPEQYRDLLYNALNTAKTSVPDLATDPGTYFKGVVENAVSSREAGDRNKYKSLIDRFAPEGFENNRIQNTVDDSAIEDIINGSYADAKQYADRLQARGVVDSTGYDRALKELGNQRTSANTKLTSLGDTLIGQERAKLVGIANQGRTAADKVILGQSFDPNSYDSMINTDYSNWLKTMPDSLKGGIDGDLFDTSLLYSTGSQATTAGNRPFVGEDDADDEDDDSTTKKRQAANAGVF